MKLIVGLGNPGREYENNRHNIGYLAVEGIAYDLSENFKLFGQQKKSELFQTSLGGEKTFFQKPLTFMNLSGEAVVEAAFFYKIEPKDICVIHDELDLPFGDVRLKIGGGEGGHNGLKSISKCLGTPNYARIRMGIGRPPHPEMDVGDYVLSDFKKNELDELDRMIDLSAEAAKAFAKGEQTFRLLMNNFNRGTLS